MSWTTDIPPNVSMFYGFEVVHGSIKHSINYTSEPHLYEFTQPPEVKEYSIAISIWRMDSKGSIQKLTQSTARDTLVPEGSVGDGSGGGDGGGAPSTTPLALIAGAVVGGVALIAVVVVVLVIVLLR